MFPVQLRLLALLVAAPALAWAMAQVNVADDDANQGMYNGGWNQGSGGDNGFFAWKMVSKSEGDGSFAGHYLARAEENAIVGPITSNRAFALFANGRGYEESVAFRGISVPLEPGDNFSFDILHGQFIPKGEQDATTPSEVGVVYRSGNASASTADASAGARLKVFAREGVSTYRLSDSEAEFDTGVPITDEAVALTVTIHDADTYDLEMISLRDKSRKLFEGRKFGGEAGAPIQSLAFFNRNSEATDFFFNNFQLSRNAP